MNPIDERMEFENSLLEQKRYRWRQFPFKMAELEPLIEDLSDEVDALNDLLNESFGEGFEKGVELTSKLPDLVLSS